MSSTQASGTDHVRGHSAPGEPSAPIVQNVGQFAPAVRFQMRTAGAIYWITDHSLWITRLGPAPRVTPPVANRGGRFPNAAPALPTRGVNLELSFPSHSPMVSVVPSDPLPSRISYFLGSGRTRWHSGVPTFGLVTWRGLYPGLSLTLASTGSGPTLVVHAARGARPPALKLRVAGATALRPSSAGVVARTAVGDVPLPEVLQGNHPSRVSIAGNVVHFLADGALGAQRADPFSGRPSFGKGLV